METKSDERLLAWAETGARRAPDKGFRIAQNFGMGLYVVYFKLWSTDVTGQLIMAVMVLLWNCQRSVPCFNTKRSKFYVGSKTFHS